MGEVQTPSVTSRRDLTLSCAGVFSVNIEFKTPEQMFMPSIKAIQKAGIFTKTAQLKTTLKPNWDTEAGDLN